MTIVIILSYRNIYEGREDGGPRGYLTSYTNSVQLLNISVQLRLLLQILQLEHIFNYIN